jgi:hypothetical protein
LKFALAQDEDQSMKRSRFSEEQIIGILKEHEARLGCMELHDRIMVGIRTERLELDEGMEAVR